MHANSATLALGRLSFVLITIVAATGKPLYGQASPYHLQTLDVLGASSTSISGINNSGQMAGTYCIGSTCHGFVMTHGQVAVVDAPNANSDGTFLAGISNSGVIVGSYISTMDLKAHGFVGSQFGDIVFPSTDGAELNTFARGINMSGQVVGFYQSDRCPSLQSCFPLHGFTLTGGSFAQIDFPGASQTTLNGINDAGDVVGFGGQAFVLSGGGFTPLNFPGNPEGINSAGVIVGGWTDGAGHAHGFVLNKGVFTSLDFLGATATTAFGINDAGDIVGSYTDTNGQGHGFITNPISLVDPVPDLLNGSTVAIPNTQASAQLLATKGTTVQGVAADGVAEVVIRIMASNVGDQFTLTLVNDQDSQIIPDEDGALGSPGDTSFSQGQVTVTAVDAGSGPNGPNPPFAFAIYRAPVDFARQVSPGLYKSGACGDAAASDDQLACRSVSVHVQNSNGDVRTVSISIVRPPVILIHGLWGDPSDWNSFSPLFSNIGSPMPDPRFAIGVVDYDQPPADLSNQPATIISSTPDYSQLPSGPGILQNASTNSLGFQFNAPTVLSQINDLIREFKSGANTGATPIAAVQADIVGHSMGGDITRTLPLQGNPFLAGTADFLSVSNFNQGPVHKVVTIDTPHLGSTLATKLLNGQNNCVANLLALDHLPTFGSVQLLTSIGPAAFTLTGAVGDLVDSPLSQALTNIKSPGPHPLPTALIAGTINSANVSGLLQDSTATLIRNTCGSLAANELATNLTPNGWFTIFSTEPNNSSDAIVGLTSQLNNLAPDPGAVFDGNIHSRGPEGLGFAGPSVLDAGPVPTQVITLLNTPVTSAVFHLLNP